MCCAVDDACTTRGWCLGSAGYVYRGGCTDNSWTSSACQQLCKLTNTGNSQNLYPCSAGAFSTVWCCSGIDSHTSSCCNNNFSFPSTGASFMPAAEALVDLGIDPTSSVDPTISTTTLDTGSTTTAIVIATATIQTNSSSGVAVGDVVGAAIGSVVVGVVIGLIAGWLIWRTSRKSSQSLPPTHSGTWATRIWELPHSKFQPENIQELGDGEVRG
ncbi:hypothetical protein BDZ45DRAFT_669452 [Acephala macrosclerotiorum]|nr:hypothetical protein BDZ45DRAFT_669452 [Acephala macrosclerotiorum]